MLKKVVLFDGKSGNENQFLRPNSVEDVSNISQSARNIIMNGQKHILDSKKSYKGHLEKRSWTPPLKREIPIWSKKCQQICFAECGLPKRRVQRQWNSSSVAARSSARIVRNLLKACPCGRSFFSCRQTTTRTVFLSARFSKHSTLQCA